MPAFLPPSFPACRSLPGGRVTIKAPVKSSADSSLSLFQVFESFVDYVAVEQLDGDNKYDAGEHGLQVTWEPCAAFPVMCFHVLCFSCG